MKKLCSILFCLFFFSPKMFAQDSGVAKDVTMEWANAENEKDTGKLALLYAPNVFFYGKKLDKNKCIGLIKGVYKKYPDYSISIEGDIVVSATGDGTFKTDFVKKVLAKGQIKKYNAYLNFTRENGKLLIMEESDLTTDANLVKMQKKINKYADYSLKGDFRGDGKIEYGKVIKPEIDPDGTDCVGPCNTKISFSDPTIPDIVFDHCIDGHPDNLGDLNDNGSDEIGMVNEWFTSCWMDYHVYTLINNKWERAVPAIRTHCDQWESEVKPIEKDLKKKGNVIIRYSVYENNDIKLKTKSIPIKK